jgi:hypothetical protein
VRNTCFLNSNDKVRRNFIKKTRVSSNFVFII